MDSVTMSQSVAVADTMPARLRAVAERTADAVLAAELRHMADSWDADRQSLASSRIDGQVIERIRSDAAAAEQDYRTNLSQLMQALIAAELRMRGMAAEAAVPRGETEIQEAVRAVQAGFAWQVAVWFQGFTARNPRFSRLLRRVLLLVWWTAHGTLFRHLRGFRENRRRLREQPVIPAAVVEPASPELPSIESGPVPEHDIPWPADQPLVSVIIPCFNYGQFLAEAVDSVLNQTWRDLEVILVEGGSTSLESRQLLNGLRRPGVRVLLQGEPHPVGANRNLGIQHARGRYVCCLDADDRLHPTYIEKAVFLLERCGYDLVSSALKFFGNRDDFIATIQRPDLKAMLAGNHVMTTAVFRRSFWEKAGGYQDSARDGINHVAEDWRLWVRIAALGARFINLPLDPMLQYRSHGASLSRHQAPMDVQREMVRRFNADVLDTAAVIQAIHQEAARRYRVPRAHLSRGVAAAPGPSLLLAMPFMTLGGAERLLSGLVGYLVTAGWRVTIVTTLEAGREHGDTMAWFEAHTPEVYRLPGSLPREQWEEFVCYLAQSRRADVVWVVGSAVVYDMLSSLKQEFPPVKIADLLFNTVGHTESNRKYRRWIDLNFVENTEVMNFLIADGAEPARVHLVRSGVNTVRLRPSGYAHDQRTRIGATRNDLVVGFSGRWSDEKNPLGFIEIARRVNHDLPVRFVMTGAGHLAPQIMAAINAGDFAPGRFHLLGEVEEIASWLAAYDLLVLPSKLDGRPVVVMESCAVGVPVLASRVGALDEMIRDGETGWLHPSDDVEGFVARIEWAATHRDALAAMGQAARAHAVAHFDETVMHAAYETRLRALIAG
jgi:O-antigen biosynthesis protein